MLKKWKLLKTESVFSSKYLGIDKSSYELPGGETIEDWYTFSRENFVIVVAQNTQNEILIERQYRPAADDFIYELPAGWIENNEDPVVAGIRELEEETGFTGRGVAYGPFYVLPGTSKIHSYVAVLTIDEKIKKETKRDVDEANIELSFISRKKLNEMVLGGEIKDEGLLVGMAVLNAIK